LDLRGVTVVMAMVIAIFGVKARVPLFLPNPFLRVGGALATVRIDVLLLYCQQPVFQYWLRRALDIAAWCVVEIVCHKMRVGNKELVERNAPE